MASTSQVRTSAILLSLLSVKHENLRSLSELKWHHIRNKFGENRSTDSQFDRRTHTDSYSSFLEKGKHTDYNCLEAVVVQCEYCYYEKVSDAERVSRKKCATGL